MIWGFCAKEKVAVESPACAFVILSAVCSFFQTPCSVCAYLNIDDGDGGLGLVKVSSHPVHGFWDEIQHQIQIHFIFLERGKKRDNPFIHLN